MVRAFRRGADRRSRSEMIELRPDSVLFVRPFLAITAGIVVLFVGKALNGRFGPLREYNIPEPVTGGLLVASALWLVYLFFVMRFFPRVQTAGSARGTRTP